MRNIPADFWKHTLAKCALQLSVPPYTPIFVGLDTVAAASRPPLWRRPKGLASLRRRRRYSVLPDNTGHSEL
jgi:hypothetical protein